MAAMQSRFYQWNKNQQSNTGPLLKKVCENKDFCGVVMPSENTKIIEFNQYQKSDKTPSIMYADL